MERSFGCMRPRGETHPLVAVPFENTRPDVLDRPQMFDHVVVDRQSAMFRIVTQCRPWTHGFDNGFWPAYDMAGVKLRKKSLQNTCQRKAVEQRKGQLTKSFHAGERKGQRDLPPFIPHDILQENGGKVRNCSFRAIDRNTRVVRRCADPRQGTISGL